MKVPKRERGLQNLEESFFSTFLVRRKVCGSGSCFGNEQIKGKRACMEFSGSEAVYVFWRYIVLSRNASRLSRCESISS